MLIAYKTGFMMRLNSLVKTIKEIQICLLEATREMWSTRCKKLFAKTEEEKEEERKIQRDLRKKKHEKRKKK